MSIFKRHDQSTVQQTSAAPSPETAQGGQSAKLMPPFVSASKAAAAPGVVPPPAAPIYSMRPPESAPQIEGDGVSLVAEKVRTANGGQQSVQEKVRVAVGVRRRAARQVAPVTPRAAQARTRPSFDPTRCAQAGLLNLAWSWQQAGSTIRAIHTYVQVLDRYPDTPAAAAAVADLVELSDILADEGQFHIALAIYDRLEQLL